MILYNLFLFFSIKDVSYLLYSLYCAGFILLQNTLTGFGAHFLWPAYPWVNELHMELLAFTNFFGFLAARSFLDLSRLPFWFRRFLNISLIACGVLMAGTFFHLPLISSLVLILFSAFMSVLLFVTAFIVWQRGYTPARFYLAAWTFLLLSVVVYSLSIVGWIPVSSLTLFYWH